LTVWNVVNVHFALFESLFETSQSKEPLMRLISPKESAHGYTVPLGTHNDSGDTSGTPFWISINDIS
jgi:hypothetical protein